MCVSGDTVRPSKAKRRIWSISAAAVKLAGWTLTDSSLQNKSEMLRDDADWKLAYWPLRTDVVLPNICQEDCSIPTTFLYCRRSEVSFQILQHAIKCFFFVFFKKGSLYFDLSYKHCVCFLGCEREAGTLHTVNRSDEKPPEWEAQLEVGVDDSHPHYNRGKDLKESL